MYRRLIVVLVLCLLPYLVWRHLHVQKLQLHIGESMRDVMAHNQRANYDPNVMFDNVPITWPVNDMVPQTFDMTYDEPGSAIRFPHARLVWATQYAGVVTGILIGVSEKKETLSALIGEVQQLAPQFKQAGWTQKGSLPTLEALRSGVAGLKTDAVEGGILAFQRGSVTAVMQIQGYSGQQVVSSEDSASYSLGVQFTDAALQDAQQTKTYKEHLRVKGSIDATMPLSYWLNGIKR